jgi:hypothetical protein
VRLEILRRTLAHRQTAIRLMDRTEERENLMALRGNTGRAVAAVEAEPELIPAPHGADEAMAIFALCEIASSGLRFHGGDARLRERAAQLFNKVAPRLSVPEQPSRWHPDLRRMLLPLARLRASHPELGLSPVPGITASEEASPFLSPMTQSAADGR